jgi:hypothetical protein
MTWAHDPCLYELEQLTPNDGESSIPKHIGFTVNISVIDFTYANFLPSEAL